MRRLLILILMFLPADSGCHKQLAETPPVAPPVSESGSATEIQLPTSTPLPTQIEVSVTPTPTLNVPLANNGPWVAFNSYPTENGAGGLWAANMDGTGLTVLTHDEAIPYFRLAGGIAPADGKIAYITAKNPDLLEGLTLNIFELPDDQVQWSITLMPVQLSADSKDSVAQAIASSSIAWSPNGNWIAFIGAINNGSADLYLFSVSSKQIIQISNEPEQAVNPAWSPDARYILYGVKSNFGLTTATHVDALRVAEIGSAQTRSLQSVVEADGEELLGWAGPHTALVTNWLDNCGRTALRAIDLDTGEERMLWEGHFQYAALDPASETILLVSGELYGHCKKAQPLTGIYLLTPDQREALAVSEMNALVPPLWSAEARHFFANTDGQVLMITLSGDVTEFPHPLKPIVSPDGDRIAWIGGDEDQGGLLLGSFGEGPIEIVSKPVYNAVWSPDGEVLFFQGQNGIYMLRTSDSVIRSLDEDMAPRDLAIVPLASGH